MEILTILVLFLAFFLGIGFLIHICSKKKCILKIISKKRKIEICPIDKSHPINR